MMWMYYEREVLLYYFPVDHHRHPIVNSVVSKGRFESTSENTSISFAGYWRSPREQKYLGSHQISASTSLSELRDIFDFLNENVVRVDICTQHLVC